MPIKKLRSQKGILLGENIMFLTFFWKKQFNCSWGLKKIIFYNLFYFPFSLKPHNKLFKNKQTVEKFPLIIHVNVNLKWHGSKRWIWMTSLTEAKGSLDEDRRKIPTQATEKLSQTIKVFSCMLGRVIKSHIDNFKLQRNRLISWMHATKTKFISLACHSNVLICKQGA